MNQDASDFISIFLQFDSMLLQLYNNGWCLVTGNAFWKCYDLYFTKRPLGQLSYGKDFDF